MTNKYKLARCSDCDALIPVEYQLGLHSSLYCPYSEHWQAHGYDVAEIIAAVEARAARTQRFQEARKFAMKQLVEAQRYLEKSKEKDKAPETPAGDITDPRLEDKVRNMLRWLDER